MADSSPDDWLDAYSIADRAKTLPAAERAAFIERQSLGRPRLASAAHKILARIESTSEWGKGAPLEPQDAIMDLTGATIGEFEIVRKIAEGGMGSVYLARQLGLQRDVALKLLRARWRDPEQQRRFDKEIRVLASLSHAYIARLFSSGTWERRGGISVPYFAMEFVSGARDIVRFCQEERLDLRRRLELLCHVLGAVDHGHAAGVVHRDLKPHNILVDAAGLPRIIDFGIARLIGQGDFETRPTVDGAFAGTLAYMAPEQHEADLGPISPRTDVYALGLVLYELACDRPAVELPVECLPMQLDALRKFTPSLPSQACSAVPVELDRIYCKAVMRTPGARYDRAGTLRQDLQDYLAGNSMPRTSPSVIRHPRLVPLLASCVVGSLAIGSGIGWGLANQVRPRAGPGVQQAGARLDLSALLTADRGPIVLDEAGGADVDLPEPDATAVASGLVCARGTLRLHDGALDVRPVGDEADVLRIVTEPGATATVELRHARLAVERSVAMAAPPASHARLVVGEGAELLTGMNDKGVRLFAVGGAGTGELMVVDGGRVSAENVLCIGHGSHGGDVGRSRGVVAGRGSSLQTWHLRVGGDDHGSLEVIDGGTVSAVHSVYLGMSPASQGVVELRNARLEITHSNTDHPGSLVVGDLGSGQLELESDSHVETPGPAIIGHRPGSTGRLVVRGGSRVVAKELVLGADDGVQASLDLRGPGSELRVDSMRTNGLRSETRVLIADGARLVVASAIQVAPACVLTMRRGTLVCPQLVSAGLLRAVDADLAGDLLVTGTLAVDGDVLRVLGDFECAADALLDITPPDTGRAIDATGTARLGGVLRIRLPIHRGNRSFTLIAAASIEGQFAHVILDPAVGSARVVTSATTLSLTVE